MRAVKLESLSNPLIIRLTRRRPPSPRLALRLALGLGLVSLLLSTRAVLRAPASGPGDLFIVLAMLLGWAISILTPLLAAIIAAIVAARNAGTQEYELLRLTNLTAGARISGFVGATLYRLRVMLALAVGLMPVLAIGGLYIAMQVTAIFYNLTSASCPPGYAPCTVIELPSEANVLETGLESLAACVNLWGAALLGAAVGTGLGLWWRNTVSAGIVAPLAVLTIEAALVLALNAARELDRPTIHWSAITAFALASYALGFAAMRLARHRA